MQCVCATVAFKEWAFFSGREDARSEPTERERERDLFDGVVREYSLTNLLHFHRTVVIE